MDGIIKDFHDLKDIPAFQAMIEEPEYLQTADHLDVVQMNIGRKCNLACKHCHVNCGPARTEEMSSYKKIKSPAFPMRKNRM